MVSPKSLSFRVKNYLEEGMEKDEVKEKGANWLRVSLNTLFLKGMRSITKGLG